MSLRELQTRFMEALLTETAQPATPWVSLTADSVAARVGVYRNTVRANVVAALRSTYPAVWRLVGNSYFCRLAHEFSVLHPSRSGDLTPLGERFPEFLDARHHADEFCYLADVARLELRIQETLLAAEHASLDLGALAQVAPAGYATLHFVLHPALRLFESRFPAHRIWEANTGSDAEPECIDLAAGGDRLAVTRHRLQLQFHRLSRGESCLLYALGRGDTFVASVNAAGAGDEDFDAAAALQRFVAIEAIVDWRQERTLC